MQWNWFYLVLIGYLPIFVHTLTQSSCSPYLFITEIDLHTDNQYVQPCPASSPCQCVCEKESQRLWIDCFHRQLTSLPNLEKILTENHVIKWNIDLAFNLFENLTRTQWIPDNMHIEHLIFSGSIAYDLIVQLHLTHRHLIDRWPNEEHLAIINDDEEEDDLDVEYPTKRSIDSTLPLLTKLNVKLRDESKQIKHFLLSLSGESSSVAILYLDHNSLDTIPIDALYNATSLYELYLSFNQIQSLPAYAFGFSHRLTRLDLSYNQISSIHNLTFRRHPKGFAGPFLIDYLDLSHNQLTILTSHVFSYLVNLRLLKLEHNQIRAVSASVWTGLYRLKHLDLSHNYLDNLTEVFYSSYLNELLHLKITSNNLSEIGSCQFLSLKSLNILNLSGNNLSLLDTCAFYGLPRKTTHSPLHIHLRSNQFQTLHPCTVFDFAPGTIHIENNPLICNCSFNYLLYDRKALAYTGQECRGGFAYQPQNHLTLPAMHKSSKIKGKKRLNTSITCRNVYKYYNNLCAKSDCSNICRPNERLIIEITTISTPNCASSNIQRTFAVFFCLIFHVIFPKEEK